MLLQALLTLWLIYAVFIIRFLRKQLTSGLSNIINENKEIGEKYDPFRRKDISKWNRFEMYFVAVFLLPIRMIHFLISTVTCTYLVKLALLGTHYTKPLSKPRRFIIRNASRILARSCLYSFGFYNIKHKKLNISNIDPSYPKEHESDLQKKPAPIVISNHISWVDIFIYMTSPECPSFMAKHDVEKYPLVGPIAQGLQALFVERHNKDQRGDIVTKLKERIERFEKFPKTTPQVLIFPEGTTSNGEYILSFKKGAFANLTPVKMYALNYEKKSYSPALDSLGTGKSFIFTMLQLYNSVTIYDLGNFYPDHLGLKTEEDWPAYAKKVKDIYLKLLGKKPTEMGFADKMTYYTTLRPPKAQ